MHQTTIFIIQLYFINELLRLKVLVLIPERRDPQKEMGKWGQTPEKQLGRSFVKLSFVLKAL